MCKLIGKFFLTLLYYFKLKSQNKLMDTVFQGIDSGILGAFLALTLVVGIQAGRNLESFRVYAVGNKDFPTAVLTASILATWMTGGVLFYDLSNFYNYGLVLVLITMGGEGINFLLTGRVLAIRMHKFLHYLSVGEAMGDLYGSAVRIITAISGILGRLGYISIQFQIIGQMLALAFNLQGPQAMVIAATLVILYSSFGGVNAVTLTDVLQFVTFSLFNPILALCSAADNSLGY